MVSQKVKELNSVLLICKLSSAKVLFIEFARDKQNVFYSLKSDQSLMEKDFEISSKSSSVKLSTSTGDEQEIKTSEEIDGILKHNNRILTGKVSFNLPNFGIFWVPIMN